MTTNEKQKVINDFIENWRKRKYSFMTFRFQTKRMITPFIEQITFENYKICARLLLQGLTKSGENTILHTSEKCMSSKETCKMLREDRGQINQ